jgi:hypothetical protein
LQVNFLSGHRYFTQSAKASRDAMKAKHLEAVKALLQK